MSFDFDRFGNTEDIPKEVTESFDVNKMPEVMFLSKFIGDFNIQTMATNIHLRSTTTVVLYNKQYEPSKNFTLTEFTKSQTALRMGIDNTPNEEHLASARKLFENVEPSSERKLWSYCD